MNDLLEISGITKSFGGLRAIDRCSLSIKRNSITGLIGPNGAGKTTIFNVISGLVTPDDGTIYLEDKDVTHMNAATRAQQGLGRSYQKIRLFEELTALDNILVAFHENKEKLWHAFTRFKGKQKSLEKRAMRLLESVGLEEKANLRGYELSYGQKKLIEILRTKANDAKMILLDEPTAGINPTLINDVTKIIKEFQKEGRTVLIVEHNMPFIMGLCDWIIVMAQGRNIAEGRPSEIQKNKIVLDAYLGKPHA